MRALKGRLEKLAGTIAPRLMDEQCPTLTERDLRYGNALQQLCRKSPPIVETHINDWVVSTRSAEHRETGNLVYAVLKCVWEHLERGTPLAMPAEVVHVYSTCPDAKPLHECEDCGYALPFEHAQPRSYPPVPVRVHFERCPLCGGEVGRWAFRLKRQRDLQAVEA